MIKCKPDTKVYLKLKEKHHVHDLSPPPPSPENSYMH